MSNLFENDAPDVDGFKEFWSLYPVDEFRRSRKSNKKECKKRWKARKLDLEFDAIMDALKQDVEDIKRGSYAFCKGSSDKMHYFPGPLPWLNKRRWDRELTKKEQAPAVEPVVVKPDEPLVLTDEMKQRFRKMAKMDKYFQEIP